MDVFGHNLKHFQVGDHQRNQADALVQLRKESLDLYNRVHSIAEDIAFVESACRVYPDLPVLPNLRCGAWYVKPEIASQYAAYFKSTDGHYNNWGFNLRRPNIHLLPILNRTGGLILVDSTRAGKRMPDALSKTVPIWCTVVNRAIQRVYGKGHGWDVLLYTPPGVVPSQEHSQIEDRLDGWAEALAGSSYSLHNLPFPLRPLWVTPATSTFPVLPSPSERNFLPVVCVSASKQIHEGLKRRSNGFAYVQGSGDDHELWGMGLTPQLFWEEKEIILSAAREDLPALVTSLVVKHRTQHHNNWDILPTPVSKTGGRLLISSTSTIPLTFPPSVPEIEGRMTYVVISGDPSPFLDPEERKDVLILRMSEGKKGQTEFLRAVLPLSVPFIGTQLVRGYRVCISCHNGKDASVGVALIALQLFFDDQGNYDEHFCSEHPADKKSLSTRLQWIISDRPEANPSRVTLKRVNEFLLTPPTFRR